MAENRTPAEILDAIADEIEQHPERWGCGGHADWSVCGCIVELLSRATSTNAFMHETEVGRIVLRAGGWERGHEALDWNDAPGRTPAEVVALFRKAAEIARAA
jgi:hypothetical protein